MHIAVVSNAPVRIHLLGRFSVVVRGDRRHLPTRKVDALLAYLAFYLEQPVNRLTVASLIWPSKSVKDARHCLNQALYSIRRTIPELSIESDRENLTLSAAGLLVDYDAFMSSLKKGAFAEAEQYFEGQLLAGMHFNASEEFDEWIDQERGAITSVAVHALEQLIGSTPHGDTDSIERVASKLLDIEPEHRKALAALRFAKRFGVEEQSDANAARYVHPSAQRLPFRGREAEARAASLRVTAAGSSAQLLLVVGEQGVGKTRFAEHVMRIAAVRGAKVYCSSSAPGEQKVPLALIHSMLSLVDAEWEYGVRAAQEAHVNAEYSSRNSPTTPQSRAGMLERALERLAEKDKIVIGIDDYQWVDHASRITIRRCIHRLRGHPVLFIICCRSERPAHKRSLRHLRQAVDAASSQIIRLRRFSDAIVANLLRERESALGIALEPDIRDAIVRTTKGHPLHLSEILAAITTRPRPFEETDLRESLQDLLKLRIRKMQPDARHCLRALAAIGRPGSSSAVAWVSGLHVAETIRCLRACLKCGLVERAGKQFTFVHEMVRQVVYATTPTRTKRVLHQRIALELQKTGGEAARVALHAVRAGDSNVAFQAALQAAEEVQSLNWLGGAEYFYRLAVEHAPTEDERYKVRWKMAAHLMFAHRFSAAQEAWAECLKSAPGPELPLARLGFRLAQISRAAERADSPAAWILDGFAAYFEDVQKLTPIAGSAVVACSCIGNVALDQGRTDVLVKLVEILKNLVAAETTTAERSAAAGLIATLSCHVGFVDESASWADQAVQEAEKAKDSVTLVRALGAQGACLMFDARPRAAIAVLSTCRQHAKESGLGELYASTVLNYVVAILDSGEFNYVEDVLEDVRDQLAAEWGHRQIYVHMNLAFIRYEQGFYNDAERLAKDVLVENHVLGSCCIHSSAWGIIGLCALRRNDRVGAKRAYDEIAHTIDVVIGTADCTYPLLFFGRYWEMRGNTSHAIAQLKRAVSSTTNRYRTCWALLNAELARLTSRRDRTAAVKTLGEIEDWAASRGCGLVLTHVRRARRGMLFPTRS